MIKWFTSNYIFERSLKRNIFGKIKAEEIFDPELTDC